MRSHLPVGESVNRLGNSTSFAAVAVELCAQNGPGPTPGPSDAGMDGRQQMFYYGEKPHHALSNLKANV